MQPRGCASLPQDATAGKLSCLSGKRDSSGLHGRPPRREHVHGGNVKRECNAMLPQLLCCLSQRDQDRPPSPERESRMLVIKGEIMLWAWATPGIYCPTSQRVSARCLLSGSKAAFLWRKQRERQGRERAVPLRGLPASEKLGPGLLALRAAKPSKGQRSVSENEWKASDKHAPSCKITNRPGMLTQEPNRI